VEVARTKATAAIDKLCSPPGYAPDCGGPYPDGAVWSNLMAIAVDGFVGPNYCSE
jgi:hypothetical protein